MNPNHHRILKKKYDNLSNDKPTSKKMINYTRTENDPSFYE